MKTPNLPYEEGPRPTAGRAAAPVDGMFHAAAPEHRIARADDAPHKAGDRGRNRPRRRFFRCP